MQSWGGDLLTLKSIFKEKFVGGCQHFTDHYITFRFKIQFMYWVSKWAEFFPQQCHLREVGGQSQPMRKGKEKSKQNKPTNQTKTHPVFSKVWTGSKILKLDLHWHAPMSGLNLSWDKDQLCWFTLCKSSVFSHAKCPYFQRNDQNSGSIVIRKKHVFIWVQLKVNLRFRKWSLWVKTWFHFKLVLSIWEAFFCRSTISGL